jgi:ABC-type antimicrobial peptide transport system permease subunit
MLLVLGRALVIVFWGLVVGLAAAWVASRIISGLLFGVGALDPATLMTGVGLLVFVGLTAALVPGLRGTRLSPVAALRAE